MSQVDDDGDPARHGDDLRLEAGDGLGRLGADGLRRGIRPGGCRSEPVDETQRLPHGRRGVARVEGHGVVGVLTREDLHLREPGLGHVHGSRCREWSERAGRCGLAGAQHAEVHQRPHDFGLCNRHLEFAALST